VKEGVYMKQKGKKKVQSVCGPQSSFSFNYVLLLLVALVAYYSVWDQECSNKTVQISSNLIKGLEFILRLKQR
jgi:hypothetical protein